MNIVLTYLQHNWQRLNLERFGTPGQLSCLMLTPGFVASSHIITFVLTAGQLQPFLVVKFPRLAGDYGRLDKEVANLNRLQGLREGGFDSAPAVLAYEDWGSYRLLTETMVAGEVMRRKMVKRRTAVCLNAAMEWLQEVSRASMLTGNTVAHSFETLAESRLQALENSFPLSERERDLLERTRQLIEPLRSANIPLVFEHGDFSAPNLLIDGNHRLGVVDWELAEPQGLPTADLLFFLSYVAFSREGAEKPDQYLNAFRRAFFGTQAWANPHLLRYCEALGLPRELLKPLFVLSWSRYLGNMAARLRGAENGSVQLAEQTVNWLRGNRYYRIWQYTVENADKILV